MASSATANVMKLRMLRLCVCMCEFRVCVLVIRLLGLQAHDLRPLLRCDYPNVVVMFSHTAVALHTIPHTLYNVFNKLAMHVNYTRAHEHDSTQNSHTEPLALGGGAGWRLARQCQCVIERSVRTTLKIKVK